MGKDSKIAWTDHTWNPWRGCAKVSEGCENCYAEQGAKRFPAVMGVWGTLEEGGTREVAAARYWRLPLHWNAEAAGRLVGMGRRPRVFLGSVMDFFEAWPESKITMARGDAWDMIGRCRNLDWILLTKRPENIPRMLPFDWLYRTSNDVNPHQMLLLGQVNHRYSHVWLGVTVENQARAEERVPLLLKIPAAVRWLSCEPLLGPIDLTRWLKTGEIHWVVVGGESMQGGRCREFNIEWAEEVVNQCDAAGVPVFVKQLGSKPVVPADVGFTPLHFKQKAGNDPEEWPEWMRRRDFPRPTRTA